MVFRTPLPNLSSGVHIICRLLQSTIDSHRSRIGECWKNSHDRNLGCGVYNECTQFVDAAIEFFDIVWEAPETDELSIERLQEMPDRQLVSTYYS